MPEWNTHACVTSVPGPLTAKLCTFFPAQTHQIKLVDMAQLSDSLLLFTAVLVHVLSPVLDIKEQVGKEVGGVEHTCSRLLHLQILCHELLASWSKSRLTLPVVAYSASLGLTSTCARMRYVDDMLVTCACISGRNVAPCGEITEQLPFEEMQSSISGSDQPTAINTPCL